MVKMNQSLHRLQGSWREAGLGGGVAAEQLREQFERLMTIYLSTKAAATQPGMLQGCLNLQASTAALLVQLSLNNQGPEHTPLSFPLPALQHSLLCYVPGSPTFPLNTAMLRYPPLLHSSPVYMHIPICSFHTILREDPFWLKMALL